MKKTYNTPIVEINVFETEDVIMASGVPQFSSNLTKTSDGINAINF